MLPALNDLDVSPILLAERQVNGVAIIFRNQLILLIFSTKPFQRLSR
jgi:hypothetical protein